MAIIASAPGKVLITGGYLILERPNAGIVLSTNARFYAIVKAFHQDVNPDSWAWPWVDVKVTSPQLSRETIYKLSMKESVLHCKSTGDSRNPFVEKAVQYSVATAYVQSDNPRKSFLEKLLLHGLDITILGSNDFYSYRKQIEARKLPLLPETLASLPPFSSITFNECDSSLEDCKPEVAKTGLGSSAAMTTAVVAAILHYLGVVNLSSRAQSDEKESHSLDLDLVHMVSQSAHCIAQGKIGSGFDVSSAVYGSQRYMRFSPEVLSSAQESVEGKGLQDVVADILKREWDHQMTQFSLPPLMTLLLGEPGDGGSSTPSMVGAVKRWQKSDPRKSGEIWQKLSNANSDLEGRLNLLSKLAEQLELYRSTISRCSILMPHKWMEITSEVGEVAVVKGLLGAREAMLTIRHYMRLMGESAGVPIEPESQTKLLDATMSTEGVLLAGVPGAGGFDAVFAVALADSAGNLIEMWSSLGVLALLVSEDPQGVSLESSDPRSPQIESSLSSLSLS